jgi:hypothetical protein
MNVAAKVAWMAGSAPKSSVAGVTSQEQPQPSKSAFRWVFELLWMVVLIPAMIAALPFLLLMALAVAIMDPRKGEGEAADFQ